MVAALGQCLVDRMDRQLDRGYTLPGPRGRGCCARTSGARSATAWTPTRSSTPAGRTQPLRESLAELVVDLCPDGRAARLHRAPGGGVRGCSSDGTSASRQRAAAGPDGDLRAVVDHLLAEMAAASAVRRGPRVSLRGLDDWLPSTCRALVALRRDLHAHPELAWAEERTTAVVAGALERAGLRPEGAAQRYRAGLRRRRRATGPVAAAARRPRRPAAGGADRAALGLDGAGRRARLRARRAHRGGARGRARPALRRAPPAPVRLLFQPAEETMPGGALRVVEQGLLAGVGEAFALHCDPRPRRRPRRRAARPDHRGHRRPDGDAERPRGAHQPPAPHRRRRAGAGDGARPGCRRRSPAGSTPGPGWPWSGAPCTAAAPATRSPRRRSPAARCGCSTPACGTALPELVAELVRALVAPYGAAVEVDAPPGRAAGGQRRRLRGAARRRGRARAGPGGGGAHPAEPGRGGLRLDHPGGAGRDGAARGPRARAATASGTCTAAPSTSTRVPRGRRPGAGGARPHALTGPVPALRARLGRRCGHRVRLASPPQRAHVHAEENAAGGAPWPRRRLRSPVRSGGAGQPSARSASCSSRTVR